jgi:iron-regulated transporter 1
MTTYLLTRHYSLSLITTARTTTSVIEIASTYVFARAANLLTKQAKYDPMAVLGTAGVTLQLALLVPCFVALASVPPNRPQDENPATAFPGATTLIFVFLGLSRLGHWTHNLAVQQIVQTRVHPPARRVEFSGVETALVGGAEMARWACGAVWSRPDQFTAVAAGGLGSLVVVWALFSVWALRAGGKGIWHDRANTCQSLTLQPS